jgi:hypothetical protein
MRGLDARDCKGKIAVICKIPTGKDAVEALKVGIF